MNGKGGREKSFLLLAGVLLILSSINTAVYAMEVGGFDVSTGVDNVDDWADWDEDEAGSVVENGTSDGTDSGTENTYEETENTGWGTAHGQETETWQPAEAWPDTDYGTGNHTYTEESTAGQADGHENFYADNMGEQSGTTEGTNEAAQISGQKIESQSSMATKAATDTPVPTLSPTIKPTATPTPVLTEVPETEVDKVTEFHEAYRIPPAKCLKKMKLYYWKAEFNGGEWMEIQLNPEAAAAVVSLRINGEESSWEFWDNKINIKKLPEEADSRVELAIMIPVDLSWTETQKNVILSYNVF